MISVLSAINRVRMAVKAGVACIVCMAVIS